MRVRRHSGFMAAALVGLLLTASCTAPVAGSRPADGATPHFRVGMVGTEHGGGQPVRGGTVTVAAVTEPGSLDPADTIASATTGGVAMAAIYDVLMRYEPATGKYMPELARSLRASDDHRRWTITLRDGVTFSDGTPLNAQAVVWSIRRYVEQGGDEADLWSANVSSMRAIDTSSVVITLKRSWPGFEYMLASGPGMIVAQSSVHDGTFTPVGAGPFTLHHYSPGEELVLAASRSYWAGRPYLDTLRFVWLRGYQVSFDALRSDEVQMALLRDPETVVRAREAGYGGFMNIAGLDHFILVNNMKGHPGSDLRVRKALAYAIDPAVINKRVYDGNGLTGKAIFQDTSRWHNTAEPISYDPDKARKLLKAAERDGYDGKITYTGTQTPLSRAAAIALKAMLEKCGFEVKLDLVHSVSALIERVAVKRNYELAWYGASIRDGSVFPDLFSTLYSGAHPRATGYHDPEMDTLIRKLQRTAGESAKRRVIADIQREWNKSVPALAYESVPEFFAWQDRVHGVVPTADSMVLFGNAWLSSS